MTHRDEHLPREPLMTPSTTAKTPLEGLASLVRNDRGTVAVITAVAIVPLILSMGLAVDVTRAYMMRAKLSAALDAAGLAVGANPNMSSSAAAMRVLATPWPPNSGSTTVCGKTTWSARGKYSVWPASRPSTKAS